MRRTILILASVAVVLVLAGGTAFALFTSDSGGAIDSVMIDRSDSITTTGSTSYVRIPSASHRVIIPSGGRLVMARFSAESWCFGGPAWCSIRIVAYPELGDTTMRELLSRQAFPLDFRFDSTFDGGGEESYSMDRSLRLETGSYVIRAEYAVSHSDALFRLDDYSFIVETAR